MGRTTAMIICIAVLLIAAGGLLKAVRLSIHDKEIRRLIERVEALESRGIKNAQ